MKSRLILGLMFLGMVATAGCKEEQKWAYPSDVIKTQSGEELSLVFFHHASIGLVYNSKVIYVDPVDSYADYAAMPKADVILITHSHSDHFDVEAINKLRSATTVVVCDATSAQQLGGDVVAMSPSSEITLLDDVHIEAVPAYNTTEGHLDFHPKSRGDCGYLLTMGGSRIYISGDGENTPEMKALRDIDVAFLSVNQPYTMTVAQAVDAVKAIKPKIFYPYHYGEVDQHTDIDSLVRQLGDVTDVRIRPLE